MRELLSQFWDHSAIVKSWKVKEDRTTNGHLKKKCDVIPINKEWEQGLVDERKGLDCCRCSGRREGRQVGMSSESLMEDRPPPLEV